MRAVQVTEYGKGLVVSQIPPPQLSDGEVSITVCAASINPVDWKIASGAVTEKIKLQLPYTPGGDVAGIVNHVDSKSLDLKAGDEVISFIGLTGGFAEQISVPESYIAHKPLNLNFSEAASIPLASLTALQALEADGRSLEGLTVLVHNAAGGVGSFAVQIAKARGATVIATASAKNAAYVGELGANTTVDFRQPLADPLSRDIDIFLDMVGGETVLELWPMVKPGGTVIRVAGGPDGDAVAEGLGIRLVKIRVQPNGAQLSVIANMIEKGELSVCVSKAFPFERVEDAFSESRDGHVKGKIVLELN